MDCQAEKSSSTITIRLWLMVFPAQAGTGTIGYSPAANSLAPGVVTLCQLVDQRLALMKDVTEYTGLFNHKQQRTQQQVFTRQLQ